MMKLPETKNMVHEMGTIQLSIQMILEDCGMGIPLNWTWQACKKVNTGRSSKQFGSLSRAELKGLGQLFRKRIVANSFRKRRETFLCK